MKKKWIQSWVQIRKDLYQRIRQHVDEKMGGTPQEIKEYQKIYAKEFKKTWNILTRPEFFKKIRQNKLVFLADFHALKQSQKSHLRVLRQFQGADVILMMECFLSRDQVWIERLMQKKISEKKFLEQIDWGRSWSFPWANYRPLVKWAMQNKVPIFGVNSAGEKSLKKRDEHAAVIVSKVVQKYPNHKIFVQYGDLHVADSKIPKMVEGKLGRKIDYLKVHQNVESIYFELLEKGIESKVEIVSFDAKTICLLSVPPWVKWQNYLFYLEGESSAFLKGYDQEEKTDFTDHVANLVQFLAQELGVLISTSRLSIFTAEDPVFWRKLSAQVSGTELKNYRYFVEQGLSFYVPSLGFGYLASPSVNQAAHLAIQYIHFELQKQNVSRWNFPKYFHQVILSEALAYFGTKLVNHRRKTETLFDMKASLAVAESQESTKDALLLALSQKTRELLVLAGRKRARLSYRPQNKRSYFIAARLLGGLLGEKIYVAYRKRALTQSEITGLYSVPLFDEKFQKAYFDLLRKVDRLPLQFKSKTERL